MQFWNIPWNISVMKRFLKASGGYSPSPRCLPPPLPPPLCKSVIVYTVYHTRSYNAESRSQALCERMCSLCSRKCLGRINSKAWQTRAVRVLELLMYSIGPSVRLYMYSTRVLHRTVCASLQEKYRVEYSWNITWNISVPDGI